MKGKISEEEEVKITQSSRKSHVETVNGKMKESSGEEVEIGIRKFRRRSWVDNMNEEVKVWTSSSKKYPT